MTTYIIDICLPIAVGWGVEFEVVRCKECALSIVGNPGVFHPVWMVSQHHLHYFSILDFVFIFCDVFVYGQHTIRVSVVQCSEEIDVWMTSIETYRYRPASELTVIV